MWEPPPQVVLGYISKQSEKTSRNKSVSGTLWLSASVPVSRLLPCLPFTVSYKLWSETNPLLPRMLLGHGVYYSSRTLTKAYPKHSYPHSHFLPLHTPSSPSWNGTIFWKALSTSQTVLHVIISRLMLQQWPYLTSPLWDAVLLRGWDYVVWSWYRLQATQYLVPEMC